MLEATIERRLVARLRAVDPRIAVLKLSVRGQAGFHDRLVLLPRAQAIYVELKRPGEQLRKLQQHRHRQIAQLGFATAVIDTVERVDALAELAQQLVEQP